MSTEDDMPARLVTVAVTWMPAARRDWGLAMLAELEHVNGTFARWRFAAGCVRVALIPHHAQARDTSAWLVVIGGIILLGPVAIAPAPAAARADWLAGIAVTSIAVYGMYQAALIVSKTPSGAGGPPGGPGGRALRGVILVGAVTGVALYGFALVHYPQLRSEGAAGSAGYAATAVVIGTVAAILGTYAWLGATRTRSGSPQACTSRRYGLVAGLFTGSFLAIGSYLPGPTMLPIAIAGLCAAITGHLASRAADEVRTGLVAGLWAGIIAGLAFFLVSATMTMATAAPHSATVLLDYHASKFHDLRSFVIAGSFGLDGDPPLLGALIPLVAVPLLCAALAAFGATRGDRRVIRSGPKGSPAQT